MLGAQGLAGGADGIDRVALASTGPRRPLRPAHLDNVLPVLAEEGGKTGAVAAGPFDRPAAPAGRVCLREVQKHTVTMRVGAGLRRGEHCADRGDDRGSEGVAVRVDADDGID